EGPPRQILYSIELLLNGEVISSPRVTVLEGEEASITITDEDLIYEIGIQIDEDGTIRAQVAQDGFKSATSTLNVANMTHSSGNGDTLQISATSEPID
ncbi:MAG: hypothetical protein VX949_08745, partial [Planctomycetota bacterium]|nr:hypothetical protein [Planctomycetota bacterium]